MVEFKDFKPADTNCRMMTESKSSVFITRVWVLFKSMDGGQITINIILSKVVVKKTDCRSEGKIKILSTTVR